MRLRAPATCSTGVITNLLRCVSVTEIPERRSEKASRGNPIIFLESVSNMEQFRIVEYADVDRFDYIDMIENRMMKSHTEIALIGNGTTFVNTNINVADEIVTETKYDIAITDHKIMQYDNDCEIRQSGVISNTQ